MAMWLVPELENDTLGTTGLVLGTGCPYALGATVLRPLTAPSNDDPDGFLVLEESPDMEEATLSFYPILLSTKIKLVHLLYANGWTDLFAAGPWIILLTSTFGAAHSTTHSVVLFNIAGGRVQLVHEGRLLGLDNLGLGSPMAARYVLTDGSLRVAWRQGVNHDSPASFYISLACGSFLLATSAWLAPSALTTPPPATVEVWGTD